MSIKIENTNFKGPYPIISWDPPCSAAVYAIMIKEDPNQLNMYTLIYFDESDNLSERDFYRSHPKFKCWIKQAGSIFNIYIAIHNMPYSAPKREKKWNPHFWGNIIQYVIISFYLLRNFLSFHLHEINNFHEKYDFIKSMNSKKNIILKIRNLFC